LPPTNRPDSGGADADGDAEYDVEDRGADLTVLGQPVVSSTQVEKVV